MAKTKNPSGNRRKDETLTNNTMPEYNVAAPAFAAPKAEPTMPVKTNESVKAQNCRW